VNIEAKNKLILDHIDPVAEPGIISTHSLCWKSFLHLWMEFFPFEGVFFEYDS